MPLIAVKFSARIVIHLTALLKYLRDCSIRVYLIWITHPHTIITERKKTTLQQSLQLRLNLLHLIKTDSISNKQHTPKNQTLSVILYGFSCIMAFWQEESAQFGLFLSENETKNRSWTHTMIHSASLATFYPRILLVNFAMSVKNNNNDIII